jgi:hypothetical protein
VFSACVPAPSTPGSTTTVPTPTTAAPTTTSTSTSTTSTSTTVEEPTTTAAATTTTTVPAPAFDTFESTDTVYSNVIQWWVHQSKLGLAFTANDDLLVYGAIWYRIRDIEGTNDHPVLHLSADMTQAPAVASEPATVGWDTTGWETIMFDSPVHMAAGEQRVIWITTYDQRDLARQGDYFVPPHTTSPGGLVTAMFPSSRYDANGWTPGTEDIPPISTSDYTSYWLFPLVTPAP